MGRSARVSARIPREIRFCFGIYRLLNLKSHPIVLLLLSVAVNFSFLATSWIHVLSHYLSLLTFDDDDEDNSGDDNTPTAKRI